MRKARENRDLTLAVSLALTAGLFAVPQTACGAPVLDPNSTRNADQVVVKQSGAVTDITGRKAHNVIDWKDFSIGAEETVRFDQGAKKKDYLNLVTGGEPSTINGKLEGGKDVYLVNPNGVVFGKGASVDVGNLYVSTTKANLDVTAYLASGASPLVNTAGQAAGDVTNLGKIAANRVEVEGGNIKFLRTGDVTNAAGANNSNVSLTTSTGTIQIGHDAGDTTKYTTRRAAAASTAAGRARHVLAAAPSAVVPEEYQTVKTLADLQSLKTGDKTVKYWLYNDIDATGQAYTPVGSDGKVAFEGTFEGNFFSVSNLQVGGVQYGGLFGHTDGATIQDVGVKGGSISATGSAGGIVGWAADTKLTNVFNSQTAVGASMAGGIVGKASGTVTIDTAYNTGAYGDHGGGILGLLSSGTATIQNAYNTDSEDGGALVFMSNPGTTLTTENAYTVGTKIYSAYVKGIRSFTNTVTNAQETSKSDYGNLTALSSSGTEDTVWRIYEGHTKPLLRAFLRGNANGSTVKVNYDYSMGKDPDGSSVAGSNGGQDLTKTYNANDLVLRNVSYTGSKDGAIDTSKIQKDSTVLHDANVYGDSKGVDYFYCGQDGYDLVGNHINIEQREVDLTNSIDTSRVMRKAYDGTTAVDADAVASLFAAGKSDGKGLILGDTTASFNTSGLTGTFDTATVGQGKTVTLNGGVTLKNAAGHNNYKISQGSTTIAGQTLQGIITPRVLTVTALKPYEKVYNKEADIDTTPAASDFQLSGDIVSGEKVELSLTSPSGTYGDGTGTAFKENANAGSRTVKLSGLSLSGANADNYILEDSEKNILFSSKYDADAKDVGGINLSSGGALFTTGTITKRNILNTGFFWYKDGVKQTAAREYDGTSAYTDPVHCEVRSDTSASADDTGMIDGDQLTFTVKNAKFVADAAKADSAEAKDVHAAKGVAYTVTVSGDAAANYTLGGAEITAGQENTVVGEGSITPRTIRLAVNAAKPAAKAYDGDAVVKDSTDATKGTAANPFTLSDGYLTYADAGDTAHHLVAGDGSTLTYTGVYEKTGETAAKDVNYANGAVQSKDITYTALVKDSAGNSSSNYVFETSDGKTEKTYAGTGVITPRTIHSLSFKDVSKVYDGDATVDPSAIEVTGVDGLVNGETIQGLLAADAQSKLTARYGSGTTDASFTANEHVVNGGAAGSKDVQYTGVQSLFGNNHNYALDPSIGDTLYGKGKITPLTIKDRAKLSLEKKKDFTKVYDGTTSVSLENTGAQAYIGALTYTTDTNKTVTLGDAGSGYTIVSADYANKNSQNGAVQNVTYALKVGGTGTYTGDYTLDASLLENGCLQWGSKASDSAQTKGISGVSDGMKGVITRRKVKASLGQDVAQKVYDGSTVVKVNGSPISAVQAVSMEAQNDRAQTGWLTNDAKDYQVAASYDDKNAGTGKTVRYAVTLTGDSAGNYALVDANGQALADRTLIGTGNIDKAPLTISFGAVKKVYDGTTDVVGKIDETAKGDRKGVITPKYDGVQTDAAKQARDEVRLTGDDAASGYRAYQAAFNSADVKEANTVSYVVALTGADAGNYYLANAKGSGIGELSTVTLADGTQQQIITGKGTIEAKTIADGDIKVTFADTIRKVYDATDSVAYDHTGDARYFADEQGKASAGDYIQSIAIGGMTLSKADYAVDAAKYNSTGVDAKNVSYRFSLTGAATSNFDLSGLQNKKVAGKAYGFQDTTSRGVSIAPKKVVAAIADTTRMEKVYNGKTDLVVNKQDDTAGTPIDTSGKIALTGLVNDNGDTAALDTAKINGRFQDADVAYDTKNQAAAKDVLFDVALIGHGAGNYRIVDASNAGNAADSAKNGSITLTGANLGVITPKLLTADFSLAERNYNATADIELKPDAVNKDKATTVSITLNGLQAGESLTLKTADIQGKYGTGSEASFTEDGNVHYGEAYAEKAGYKAVQYSNLQQALADAAAGPRTSVKNYTIADTAYFDEAAKKGRIKRLALTAGDVEDKWNLPITKVYDGTDVVVDAQKYFSVQTKADGPSKLGVEIPIDYTLGSAVYDNKQKDVGQGFGVTYTVDGLADREFHNFVMPENLTTKYTGSFHTAGASITPRVLSLDLSQTKDWIKTYDGTRTLKNADGSEVKLTLGHGYVWHKNADGRVTGDIVRDDTGTVQLAVTASYDDDMANIAPEGKKGGTPTNGKTISYTVQLTGNDAGNYTLDASNAAKGSPTETKTVAGAATGDIRQKVVMAGWQNGAPTGIDKVYDGTPDVDGSAAAQYKNQVQLDDTAILSGDAGKVQLNLGAFTGQYVDAKDQPDANVSRGADGAAMAKTVQFSASLPNLSGARAGNYYLETRDLKGSGTITPAKAVLTLAPITKVYDTTTALGSAYFRGSGRIDPSKVVTIAGLKSQKAADGTQAPDDLGLTVDSGSYANAHVDQNREGKGVVQYTLSWTNGNYDLDVSDGAVLNEEAGVKNGVFSGSASVSGAIGTITPFTVAAGLRQSTGIDKIYDGTRAADTTSVTVTQDVYEADKAKGVKVNIAGNYDSENVHAQPEGRHITYTLSLDGDTHGDYTLDTQTLQASGNITKRTVYVDFADPNAVNRKIYDGTTAIEGQRAFALSGEQGETGLVAKDQGKVLLDTAAIEGAYDSPDVKRDPDGRVSENRHTVTYQRFALLNGDNYALTTRDGTGVLKGRGTIDPKAVQVSIRETPSKEYDGTTAVADAQAGIWNIDVDRSALIGSDTLNVSLQSGKVPSYDNAHSNQTNGGQGIGVTYALNWDNGNYALAHTPSGSSDTQSMTTDGLSGALRTESGIITPRTLTIDSVAALTKVYDGTRAVEDTVVSQTRDEHGVYHDGDERNHSTAQIRLGRIVNDDTIGFTASGQYDNPYAASSESGDTQAHTVTYRLSVTNTDYALASDTVTGEGTILRRGLTVQAVPAEIYAGQDMPAFTGRVTGWMPGESDGSADFAFQAYSRTVNADGQAETMPLATAQVPGSYAVYGMYNGRAAGNYGQNYRFEQAPENDTAFTINYIPDKPYRETINPSHHPANGGGISVPRSQNAGTDFVKPAQANIAYPAKGGPAAVNLANSSDTVTSSAYRAYTQQRGTTIGTMEILNADVVNLDSSRRVDLGDSTVAMQPAAGSRVGHIEIKSADNGATLTIMNDFPDVFEAEHQVSEKKAQAAVENASA